MKTLAIVCLCLPCGSLSQAATIYTGPAATGDGTGSDADNLMTGR